MNHETTIKGNIKKKGNDLRYNVESALNAFNKNIDKPDGFQGEWIRSSKWWREKQTHSDSFWTAFFFLLVSDSVFFIPTN